MKKIEYYCDCCGIQVKSEEDLKVIKIYSNLKQLQGYEDCYDDVDLCQSCEDELEYAVHKKFEEIKKSKNK